MNGLNDQFTSDGTRPFSGPVEPKFPNQFRNFTPQQRFSDYRPSMPKRNFNNNVKVITEPTAQIRTNFRGYQYNPILFVKLTYLINLVVNTYRVFKTQVTRNMILPLLNLFDRSDRLPVQCNCIFDIITKDESAAKRAYLAFSVPDNVDDDGEHLLVTLSEVSEALTLLADREIKAQNLYPGKYFHTKLDMKSGAVTPFKDTPTLLKGKTLKLDGVDESSS